MSGPEIVWAAGIFPGNQVHFVSMSCQKPKLVKHTEEKLVRLKESQQEAVWLEERERLHSQSVKASTLYINLGEACVSCVERYLCL